MDNKEDVIYEELLKQKIKLYLEHESKFEWFIVKWFDRDRFDQLHKMAVENNIALFDALTNIWFILPDSTFNIIENPDGWSEFLEVIEI